MVNIITSIGRNGLQDYILQRISAIVLAFYTVYLGYFLFATPELTYEMWFSFCQSLGMRLLTSLVLISLIIHAWIGVITVITDYIKIPIIRLSVQLIVIFSLIIFFFWGFIILWSF